MRQPHQINPPKWPLKILRFFLKKEYLEEIEGDMEEVFYENVEEYSLNKAKRMYTWEMIRLLRPALIGIPESKINFNHYSMLKNYFKTSSRSLMKNPLTSFINIFGLAVAIGICLVVYASLEFDYSIDRFHKNKDEVYLITHFGEMDGTLQQYGKTPRPLGQMLKEDFSQIKNTCRIEDFNVVVKYEDKVFHERVRFADPEFLEMFTFPLKWGVENSLTGTDNIILSEDMSIKYFGSENPVGQNILIKFDDGRSKLFKITGVADAFPKAHIIDFKFLVNFENAKVANPAYNFYDWSQFLNATLIQVENPADLTAIAEGMDKYKILQNESQNSLDISSFCFEQLDGLHLSSANIRDGISYDYSGESRLVLPILALFMLALACFNYINIAIVSASKRLKEIGVRKVIGASQNKVVVQFLAENIFVTFFALLLGTTLAMFVFLPWFVDIAREAISINLIDIKVWIFLVTLLVLTGVISGIYPAFYISKFEAVKIFKGSLQFGKKNPLTKIFLGFQLILACILITGAVMYAQNTAFQAQRSWGYDQEQTLYANVLNESGFEKLRNEMEQEPNVISTAGSKHHLGKENTSAVLHFDNKQYEVLQLSVGAAYFETMGLQLSSGRFFKEQAESDKQAIVVNELLIKNLKLGEPLGLQFEIDSTKYDVIGVVKDFHINSFYEEVRPTIFKVAEEKEYKFLSMKVKDGSEKEVYEALQQNWLKLFPEEPFQGGYQRDVWEWFYIDLDTQNRFSRAVASIAVLLACLGFYGLVTLNVSGRIREFSIRKVLGADINNIAKSITKQYMVLVAVPMIIGAPLSFFLIKAQMHMMYPVLMPMDISGVTIAVLILILVLLSVIAIQVRKVSKSNPLKGLKVE